MQVTKEAERCEECSIQVVCRNCGCSGNVHESELTVRHGECDWSKAHYRVPCPTPGCGWILHICEDKLPWDARDRVNERIHEAKWSRGWRRHVRRFSKVILRG